MTPSTQQAPPVDDDAGSSCRNARTELRDALVAIFIAVTGVASAVAMVVIPQRLPAPEEPPFVCHATHAQRHAHGAGAMH